MDNTELKYHLSLVKEILSKYDDFLSVSYSIKIDWGIDITIRFYTNRNCYPYKVDITYNEETGLYEIRNWLFQSDIKPDELETYLDGLLCGINMIVKNAYTEE